MIYHSVLIGILPWIFLSIGSVFFGFRISVLVALVLQIILFIPFAKSRNYTTIETFSLFFFTFFLIISFILGDNYTKIFTMWSAMFSYVCLTDMSWGSIILRDPFTRQYARRYVPKEYWNTNLFLSSTMSTTLGWSMAFLGGAIFSFIGISRGLNWVFIQAITLGCIAFAVFWHKRVMGRAEVWKDNYKKTKADF